MTVYVARTRAAHRAPRRPWRTALAAALALCGITAAATLGPVAWQLHRDRAEVTAGQAALGEQWDSSSVGMALVAGRPAPGGPIGRLHLPRLGLNWIMAEGVDEQALRGAPGHFPATADVGQRGNFAVAGHRDGGVFADLDQMQAGDPIVVETRTRWYTYRVTSTLVTPPDAFAHIAPVPPGMSPGRLLTLMTCWPRLDNTHRLWVHAVLERTSKEAPPELTEGDHR